MFLKKRIIIISLVVACIIGIVYLLGDRKDAPDQIRDNASEEFGVLEKEIEQLLQLSEDGSGNALLQKQFLKCRNEYKKSEYYIEYFFPATARLINGAPIAEIELGENLVEDPGGFQVIEDYIYNELTSEAREELTNEIRKLMLALKRIKQFNLEYQLTDAQLFDAVRLEVFRIITLGITGFDTPLSLQGLPESASALSGIEDFIGLYKNNEEVMEHVERSTTYLNEAKDFNSFDRLTFITEYLQPLSNSINALRKDLKIETVASTSALHNDAISLFQKDAINPDKFVSNYREFISKEKIDLGKQLFNDAILSKGANRTCGTCHHPDKAFTDGLKTASGLSNQSLLRNTPTLTYAGFQRGFFYDLKAGTLEDQALDVVHNADEMGGSLEEAAKKMNAMPAYAKLFAKAFESDTIKINSWKIQHVLASYIRSLAPFSSRFDQYMQGNKKKLSDVEKRGFNLFMGKAKCATCHFTPLFNGTPAPLFDKSEAEVLGVPSRPDTINAKVDEDLGRYALNAYDQYKFAFKTPTLRNISKTAPYMHNGVYETLEQVMDFYNRGGGSGINIHLENQTLSDAKLNLSPKEIKEIIAFMHTLEDK